MSNRFENFQEKRMMIFGELVRRYWNGKLNAAGDLNQLADEIRDKYQFQTEDMPFIRDHIRIAMGLDTKQGSDIEDELGLIKKSVKLSSGSLQRLTDPANFAIRKQDTALIPVKYESHVYNGEQRACYHR